MSLNSNSTRIETSPDKNWCYVKKRPSRGDSSKKIAALAKFSLRNSDTVLERINFWGESHSHMNEHSSGSKKGVSNLGPYLLLWHEVTPLTEGLAWDETDQTPEMKKLCKFKYSWRAVKVDDSNQFKTREVKKGNFTCLLPINDIIGVYNKAPGGQEKFDAICISFHSCFWIDLDLQDHSRELI